MANFMLDEPAFRTATQSYMVRSGDDIRPSVDINGTARDAAGKRRGQIRASEADIHDVDQLAHRRLLRGLVQQQLEILQPRQRPCLQGAGRNRMHADSPWAELEGEVAARRFQRRL